MSDLLRLFRTIESLFRQASESAMNQPAHVNIDLDKLADIGHLGVRRAVLFMGLGLNAINQPGFRDYQLHKLPIEPGMQSLPIDFFPPDLPDDRIDTFKLSSVFGLQALACVKCWSTLPSTSTTCTTTAC